MPKKTLLVVAKQPVPGKTKTRLCPPLTPNQATGLYESFLIDTLNLMRLVPDVRRVIGFLPEDAGDYFAQIAPDIELACQRGNALGERLDHLLTDTLSNGSEQAVVMDSDSPNLPVAYLCQAFDLLTKVDVVLGPTRDGGYYLIGMKRPQPHLLHQVQMSTMYVLSDTLALAKATGLTVSLLPAWYDVDTIADLEHLAVDISASGCNTGATATRDWLEKNDWGNS